MFKYLPHVLTSYPHNPFYTLLLLSLNSFKFKILLKKKNNSFYSLPRSWFRKQISMYLTCFLFRFLSVSHTSTLSHHPYTSKPPSFSLSILFGPITHTGRILYFGWNWLKRPRTPETHQNKPKFNLRWNKGDYHSSLYVGTRFSCHFSRNEMDLITLVFGMGGDPYLMSQCMIHSPLKWSECDHSLYTSMYFNVWLCCTILQVAKVYDTCNISLQDFGNLFG